MLSKKQQEIVETKEKYVVVMASVSAGKTRVLTERVRHLLKTGVPAHKIVVITFTNAAAGEMRRRLGEDAPGGLKIMTVHSYANHLLSRYNIPTAELIQEEDFDGFFELIKEYPRVIQEVEHLLLDEAQDSDENQVEFLMNYVRPKNFFLVGDIRQAIYSFAGSDPQLLLDIMIQKDVAVYSLNENYRNGKDILKFAKKLLSRSGLRDNAIAMTDETGEVIEMELNVPDIIRMIKNDGNFSKWFILTRTNAESERMIGALMTANIPYDTFKKGNLRDDQLQRKMEENTVKVLTIHTSKGLENDNVVVVGARYYNEEEYRVAYVAATRARKRLIWTSSPRKKRRRY